jgi:type IV pilus assembly protein PilB
MHVSDGTLEKLLRKNSLISDKEMESLKLEVVRLKKPLQQLVIDSRVIDEKALTQLFSDYSGIPFVTLNPQNIPSDLLEKIPERIARQYNAVLFNIDDDGTAHLAMEDPEDVQAVDFLKKEIGTNVHIYIATRENIQEALQGYRGDAEKEISEVIDVESDEETQNSDANQVSEEDVSENSPIAQTVNLVLEYAIRSKASDVHIEPRDGYIQIRYRIDGVLHEQNRLPRNVHAALISRIKILSNLKIDERRVPQDGRFKINVAGKKFALRVSTLPISEGEKAVIRILDESNEAVGLRDLGIWGKSLDEMNSALTQPHGMILVTGPTGSGKSTTLFSALTKLNQPNVNISTIEDPVEYRVPGVNQTQTNDAAGMTFAAGLRALLRQDPNIMMVGEIRDKETASLAVQAALTGHLVLSAVHTNNAATTLPRLLDMEIEPFLIASTVRVIVGQRLVRKLDPETRVRYSPSEEEKKVIAKLLNIKDSSDYQRLHEMEKEAAANGVGGDVPLSTDPNGIQYLYKQKENLDQKENFDGFSGRMGIYELLLNSPLIQKLISSRATSAEIQAAAIGEGMLTMQSDGILKALRGETTIEEVMRVTKE